MASTGKKWLIGCGAGCGFIILVNIILFVGAGFMLTQPMNKAVNSQEELVEVMGEPEDFVPSVDGLSPGRIQAFLAVRQELMPHCEELEKIAGNFQAMEELDEVDEPSTKEIFQGLGKVFGGIKGMVTEMGRVIEVRNYALLEQEMGLGEYTWIYVLTYYSYLGYEPNTGIEDEGGGLNHREKGLMEDLMKNHAEALRDAGFGERAQVWLDEADKLDWLDSGVPFDGGDLPEEVLLVLESYRLRLEESYCPPMADMDLGQIEKKGMSFHSH